MEITIRLVLVAMVGVITALIAVGMVTGKATDFTGFLDSQSKTSECELLANQDERYSDRWNELDCSDVLSDSSGDSETYDACPDIPGNQESKPCIE